MNQLTMQHQVQLFRELHNTASPLVLPNAWDGVSARLMESCGAKAIATTSGGVSWAHGYPDGGRLPLAAHLATVREIVRAVSLPVSVDVEHGYADDAVAAAAHVAQFMDAGAVGINIEDGAGAPELLAAKIAAIRELAMRKERDVFINARTDVFLRALVPPEQALAETLRRAVLYREAGADGIFVPGMTDLQQIRQVTQALDMPLNLMALPGLAGLDVLAAHGVQRVSLGVYLLQAALARVQAMAGEVLQSGRFEGLFAQSLDYRAVNAMLNDVK